MLWSFIMQLSHYFIVYTQILKNEINYYEKKLIT